MGALDEKGVPFCLRVLKEDVSLEQPGQPPGKSLTESRAHPKESRAEKWRESGEERPFDQALRPCLIL